VVAVVEVLVVDEVVVGVVGLVEVLVDDVDGVLVDEVVVGVVVLVEDVCSRQFLAASSAIVLAAWFRFRRKVELTVTGRV
jgi:hypothetical protein